MLRALFALSDGRRLSPESMDEARKSRNAFLRRSCVKFVVMNKRRTSDELQTFAVDALGLMLVHEDADYVLFAPGNPPPCDPPSSRARRRFRDMVKRPKRNK